VGEKKRPHAYPSPFHCSGIFNSDMDRLKQLKVAGGAYYIAVHLRTSSLHKAN
jgi:hypothetical protein